MCCCFCRALSIISLYDEAVSDESEEDLPLILELDSLGGVVELLMTAALYDTIFIGNFSCFVTTEMLESQQINNQFFVIFLC